MIRAKNIFSNFIYIITFICIDFFVLLWSMQSAILLRDDYLSRYFQQNTTHNIDQYFWIVIVVLLFFLFEKIYFIRHDFWSDIKKVYRSLLFAFVGVFTIITLSKMGDEYARSVVIFFFIIAFMVIPITKRYSKKLFFKWLGLFQKNIKIVGGSDLVKTLQIEIEKNWYFGFKEVELNYEMVLIPSKNIPIEKLKELIKKYSERTKDVYVVPYMHHLDFTHANVIDYFNVRLSAIHIENRLLTYQNTIVKYFFEKLLVVVFFPFALFLHLFVSALIKLDSKGSVFFKQKRLGKNGKTFSCYKYRTMYEDGDKILEDYLKKYPQEIEYYDTYHKYQNDPRITRLGRVLRGSSLDEFPQFFNILRGDMNLIGPRPYMLREKEKLGDENAQTILKAKPGITGLWQVSGRNDLTFEQRIELDMWYIQNWSLWMDFVIFIKTIKVVLFKIGAR